MEYQVSVKQKQVRDADHNVPAAVTMCLPRTKEEAASVLFFLYMPDEFRVLSRASFLAQQMLNDIEAKVKTQILAIQWHEFVDKTTVKLTLQTDDDLKFGSHSNMQKKCPPTTVRHHHNKQDGIFYPDELNMEIVWYGGRNATLDGSPFPFNPFLVTSPATSVRYTPKLDKMLQ